MPRNYWILRDRKKYGPYTSEKLRSLAAEAKIKTEDMISADGTQWHAAGSVKGLFPHTPSGGPPSPSPSANLPPVETAVAKHPHRLFMPVITVLIISAIAAIVEFHSTLLAPFAGMHILALQQASNSQAPGLGAHVPADALPQRTSSADNPPTVARDAKGNSYSRQATTKNTGSTTATSAAIADRHPSFPTSQPAEERTATASIVSSQSMAQDGRTRVTTAEADSASHPNSNINSSSDQSKKETPLLSAEEMAAAAVVRTTSTTYQKTGFLDFEFGVSVKQAADSQKWTVVTSPTRDQIEKGQVFFPDGNGRLTWYYYYPSPDQQDRRATGLLFDNGRLVAVHRDYTSSGFLDQHWQQLMDMFGSAEDADTVNSSNGYFRSTGMTYCFPAVCVSCLRSNFAVDVLVIDKSWLERTIVEDLKANKAVTFADAACQIMEARAAFRNNGRTLANALPQITGLIRRIEDQNSYSNVEYRMDEGGASGLSLYVEKEARNEGRPGWGFAMRMRCSDWRVTLHSPLRHLALDCFNINSYAPFVWIYNRAFRELVKSRFPAVQDLDGGVYLTDHGYAVAGATIYYVPAPSSIKGQGL